MSGVGAYSANSAEKYFRQINYARLEQDGFRLNKKKKCRPVWSDGNTGPFLLPACSSLPFANLCFLLQDFSGSCTAGRMGDPNQEAFACAVL